MSDIEQTFCLMGLIVCLGVCLVWAPLRGRGLASTASVPRGADPRRHAVRGDRQEGRERGTGVTAAQDVLALAARAGSDFAERYQAALRLVPQHKLYTPKALQERDVTDIVQFRMVA